MAVRSVHDLAAFLTVNSRAPLATMRLHKLCYYAQGWHLAWADSPLFAEPIEARKSGPVIPALFETDADRTVVTSWPEGNLYALSREQAKMVRAVLDSYGHLTGIAMSEHTRKEAPWLRAGGPAVEEAPYPIIDPDVMRRYFLALTDAPEDEQEYANRFLDRYGSEPLPAVNAHENQSGE